MHWMKEKQKGGEIFNNISSDLMTQYRSYLIGGITVLAIFHAIFYMIYNVSIGRPTLAMLNSLEIIIGIPNYLIFRKFRNYNSASSLMLAVALFILHMNLIFASEGAADGLLYWLFVFPPLAFFLKGTGRGSIWTLGQLALIIGIATLDHYRVITTIYSFRELLEIFNALIMTGFLLGMYEWVRAQFEKRMITTNKILEHRVKEETDTRIRHQELMLEQGKLASLGEMIGLIAHQWRQPLNVISVIADVMEADYVDGDLTEDNLKKSTDELRTNMRFMNQTIEDFRLFLKPNRKKKPFSTLYAIEDTLALIAPALSGNGIMVQLEANGTNRSLQEIVIERADRITPDGTDFVVFGHPNEFKQTILNLLVNASDAIKAVRHDSKGQITLILTENLSDVIITIIDNGGGIPLEHLPHIFERHYTTKSEKGTGLGLYMCQRIICDSMLGDIAVSNTIDGSRFTITLPKNRHLAG